jgi:hypothetical protein
LASYVLDVFQNVFLSDLPAGEDMNMRLQAFYMAERIRRVNGDLSKLSTFVNIFTPFCTKWGIKFEEFPDYKDGMHMIVKKYQASFESAVIDAHKDALG